MSKINHEAPNGTTSNTSFHVNVLSVGESMSQFVLRELQDLSDTGIYRTLSLKGISAAATQVRAYTFQFIPTLWRRWQQKP